MVLKNHIFVFLFCLFGLFSYAQTKVDEKTKVKNYVISKTKNGLEFPKYYKTEKITVEQLYKGKPVNIVYGSINDKVAIYEQPKYFTVKVDSLYETRFQKDKLYKINELLYDTEYNYYTIVYKKNTNMNDSFVYDGNSDIELYSKQSFIKYLDSEYRVNIWFWAMSKGGTIRLYNELGTAYVNNKGIVTYIVDEPVE